jgi:hypothetical protein
MVPESNWMQLLLLFELRLDASKKKKRDRDSRVEVLAEPLLTTSGRPARPRSLHLGPSRKEVLLR